MNIKHIIWLIIAVTMIALLIIQKQNAPPEEYRTETYIVKKGDTAWAIMNKRNYADKDIRELIHYIEQDNKIDAGKLQIGQDIIIRIYGDDGINEKR